MGRITETVTVNVGGETNINLMHLKTFYFALYKCTHYYYGRRNAKYYRKLSC